MEKKVSGKHSSMNGFAMMKGRVATVVLASALLLGGGLTAQAQNTALTTCSQSAATAIPQNPNWKANAAEWQKLKGEITLYMTNDMGRNGYYGKVSRCWMMPAKCCYNKAPSLISFSFISFLPHLISFLPLSSIKFVLILGKVLVVIRKKCTFA